MRTVNLAATPRSLTPTRPSHGCRRVSEAGRKRKVSWDEKLRVLGQGAPPAQVLHRLETYRSLFAYRRFGAIVTKVGQGPRAWTKLPQPLGLEQIVRHLLADTIPSLTPVWYGARSFESSKWVAVDVDADRDNSLKLYTLDELRCLGYRGLPKRNPSKPSFAERCVLVERAFRRMGVDPSDPRQVLVLPTPSGGRHYYLFLDAPYLLDQLYLLLNEAGLAHSPGQFEFFPSATKGFRLPFGHIPGRRHDPDAWIQFVDDYDNGRIRRHSLGTLFECLQGHRAKWAKRRRSPKPMRPRSQKHLGRNKTDLPRGLSKPDPKSEDRYDELLQGGITSADDAQELMGLGIRKTGTRTEVLLLLALHLVWFRRLPAAEAAEQLTQWAMDSRHNSKDIAEDLARGRRVVGRQIEAMCRWAADKDQNTHTGPYLTGPEFSRTEIDSLLPHVESLADEVRWAQAAFLLCLLRFAKRYGRDAPDSTGRDVALPINAVVKKWPGCSHMKYKARISHAVAAGVLTKVKGHWHIPGRAGRATTYRLGVPVNDTETADLDFDTALDLLTCPRELVGHWGEGNPSSPETLTAPTTVLSETTDANHPAEAYPGPVREERSGRDLGADSRERHPEWDAASGLRGFNLRERGTSPPLGFLTGRGCLRVNETGRECYDPSAPDRVRPGQRRSGGIPTRAVGCWTYIPHALGQVFIGFGKGGSSPTLSRHRDGGVSPRPPPRPRTSAPTISATRWTRYSNSGCGGRGTSRMRPEPLHEIGVVPNQLAYQPLVNAGLLEQQDP